MYLSFWACDVINVDDRGRVYSLRGLFQLQFHNVDFQAVLCLKSEFSDRSMSLLNSLPLLIHVEEHNMLHK